ncbi:MAG: ArsR/SmtB family transcription factor [Anaerolineae bacterium]
MDPYRRQTAILKALAHPARLQILDALRAGAQCVCHLEALLGLRQAYVSQQLARLREAGLVVDNKEGLNVFYQVKDPQVFETLDRVRAMTRVTLDVPAPVVMGDQVIAGCVCPNCRSTTAVLEPTGAMNEFTA